MQKTTTTKHFFYLTSSSSSLDFLNLEEQGTLAATSNESRLFQVPAEEGCLGKVRWPKTGYNPLFWPWMITGHQRKSRVWLIAEDISLRSTASDSWTCLCVVYYRGSALFTPFNEKKKEKRSTLPLLTWAQNLFRSNMSSLRNVPLWIMNTILKTMLRLCSFLTGFAADVCHLIKRLSSYCFFDICIKEKKSDE